MLSLTEAGLPCCASTSACHTQSSTALRLEAYILPADTLIGGSSGASAAACCLSVSGMLLLAQMLLAVLQIGLMSKLMVSLQPLPCLSAAVLSVSRIPEASESVVANSGSFPCLGTGLESLQQSITGCCPGGAGRNSSTL